MRGAQAGIQFHLLRTESLGIVPHFHVADGLGAESEMVSLDTLLGFPKQVHEVRQRCEAVGAEAHLYVDSTIGGRLGEDVCHTSDEELRVIVDRPVDSECLVGSIDRLQTARSGGHRVHHVARPGLPGVWLSTLLTGDNPLQAREDLLVKVQVGLRQGRHSWRCGQVDE